MSTFSPTNTTPERIDVVLARDQNLSRAQAQKLLKDGRVLVNGKVPNGHQLVDQRAVIDVTPHDAVTPAPPLPLPPLVILYEVEDVIVVNKPAGVLVHPTSSSTEPTMVDALKAHVPGIEAVGDDVARAGIVHRLDKMASGVLIAAKNSRAFLHLKQQFADRLTEKHYIVLVMGSVLNDEGTITFPIGRSKTKARMAARPHSQDGKDAVTHYEVTARYTSATLLNVAIETGRTHQIRAHMFALGNPVAGDTLYVKKGVKQLPLPRLFLHAASLTLTLPDGTRHTFSAPLPEELANILPTLTPTEQRFIHGVGSA